MLPSRGCCHGVFLLSHAARLKERRSIDEWITAARQRATFMSHALNLREIAGAMVDLGLAEIGEAVTLAGALHELSSRADTPTLLAIARLWFRASPPEWLALAVSDGEVIREHIPSSDLSSLVWAGHELDELILDAYAAQSSEYDDGFLKEMGNAAELLVFAALQRAGENPVHVSLMSDAYGYDIECRSDTVARIEVKAASRNSMSRFHISRNEYEKSVRHGSEWRLLQVIFSTRAFVCELIDASQVDEVRELRQGALQHLVPSDTPAFRWSQSAEISPPIDAWGPCPITLDPAFTVKGFRRSGRAADTSKA
jgi:hypothetical protein